MNPLILKPGEERRLKAGHLWIFSNEVDVDRSALTDFEPGDAAVVRDARGKPLGTALVNPRSLICARLISRRPEVEPGRGFFRHALVEALALRERLFDQPGYRLVFAEGDGLPGLVLDRFGDCVVGQLNTAGMDARRGAIEKALADVLAPAGVLWRNDSAVRELEGLDRHIVPGTGSMPATLTVRESGLEFVLDPVAGQKTGWFYDQAANRARVRALVPDGARVLDVYCYHGAWGLMAAHAGAAHVTCVDASEPAIARLRENAQRNGLSDRVHPQRGDAAASMEALLAEHQRFDLVIVDPPALVKRGRDVKPGLAAYRRINELALRLVAPGGVLVTCSCSSHVREDVFCERILQAARHVDRDIQVLMRLEQGPDHPVHPAIPETRYLKGLVARVVPSR